MTDSNRTIYATGYPKSGLTWFIHVLTTVLGGQAVLGPNCKKVKSWGPVTSDYRIVKTHWAADKDEELRHHCGPGQHIIILRDPRDTFISAAYYRGNDDPYTTIEGEIDAGRYDVWMRTWFGDGRLDKPIWHLKYEELWSRPVCTMRDVLWHLCEDDVSDEKIIFAFDACNATVMRDELTRHFVRRASPGEWRTILDQRLARKIAESPVGEWLLFHRYETDPMWWLTLPKEV